MSDYERVRGEIVYRIARRLFGLDDSGDFDAAVRVHMASRGVGSVGMRVAFAEAGQIFDDLITYFAPARGDDDVTEEMANAGITALFAHEAEDARMNVGALPRRRVEAVYRAMRAARPSRGEG